MCQGRVVPGDVPEVHNRVGVGVENEVEDGEEIKTLEEYQNSPTLCLEPLMKRHVRCPSP